MKDTTNHRLLVKVGLAATMLAVMLVAATTSSAEVTVVAVQSNSELGTFEVRCTATFSEDELIFGTLMDYDTVRLADGEYLNAPGQPMLPAQTVRVALPAGMAVTGVRTIESTAVELAGEYSVFPAQPPQRVSDVNGPHEFTQPDAQTYASTEAYPASPVEFTGQTDLAGQSIAILRVFPVHCVPAASKLALHTSVQFVIEGTTGYECGDYLPLAASEQTRAAYQQTVANSVVNPEHVALQVARALPGSRDLPSGGPYDHVIISRSADVSYWNTLADWHTKRGLKDVVVTTDYIYSEYSGSDNQARIRNFVIDAHATWGTMYFLLCGENGDVPFEYRTYESESIPGDEYYADYDDDWTYEVYVGRSTARGSTEVNRFVAKVLKYEKDPPLTNYPLDVTLLGMDLTTEYEYPYYTLTRGQNLKETIDAYIPASFNVTKVYDTYSENHRTAFINALNDGQNLVNHCDHGDSTVMCTGDRRHGWYLDNGDIDALTNTNYMSIIYSLGCHCNELDYNDAISEHFVIYNDLQAAVAFTGNTRSGWFYVGDADTLSGRLDRYWWRALFVNDKWKLGETLANTKQYCSHSDDVEKYCHWTLNLLGEPEMSIWTDVPEALTVTHDATLPVGSSSFNVHVQDGSGNVNGALVCLWKGAEVYLTGTTNSSGYAYFTPAPTTVGTMYVTVTKHNYLPHEGEAEVVEGATCSDGIQNQGEDLIDCGGPCPACDCLDNGDCAYCNGETCDAYGECQAGGYPCSGSQWCDEVGDSCINHGNGDFEPDADVDLDDFRTFQECFGQSALGGCEPANMTGVDGMVDLDDFAEFEGVMTGP